MALVGCPLGMLCMVMLFMQLYVCHVMLLIFSQQPKLQKSAVNQHNQQQR